MRRLLVLTLLLAACGRPPPDPVLGCETETVCARVCDEPRGWASWCARRCGACEPSDALRPGEYEGDDGYRCRVVEVPIVEAAPLGCWTEDVSLSRP